MHSLCSIKTSFWKQNILFIFTWDLIFNSLESDFKINIKRIEAGLS
jgi:hypothetical protein